MSRGLFSFLSVWLLTGLIAVQASVAVTDASSSPLLSEGAQEQANLALILGFHVALLVSCLWIARVEGALRDVGLAGRVRTMRITQAVVVGACLGLYLLVTAIVGAVAVAIGGEDALRDAILGPAGDEEALSASLLAIVASVGSMATIAALVSVPFYWSALLRGGGGTGRGRAAGLLGGVTEGLRDGLWAALPLAAEAALVAYDAVDVMSSHEVSPLNVIAILLVPIASLPGLVERWRSA